MKGSAPSKRPDGLLGVAAEHATRSIPLTAPSGRVGEVRATLAGQTFESASDVAVVERGALAGVVRMERLLAAGADQPVAEIMDGDPPVVGPGTDQGAGGLADGRARRVEHRRGGRGGAIRRPHTAQPDARRAAGRARRGSRASGRIPGRDDPRTARDEGAGRSSSVAPAPLASHRLARSHGVRRDRQAYEAELEANVLLAFFIPAVVYMADAVGTQTEALLIRGLAVGVGLRSVVRRELTTGLAIGMVIACAFFPFALAVWGDTSVAFAVALALLALLDRHGGRDGPSVGLPAAGVRSGVRFGAGLHSDSGSAVDPRLLRDRDVNRVVAIRFGSARVGSPPPVTRLQTLEALGAE